jgi:TrmH family RNA methyltransferase
LPTSPSPTRRRSRPSPRPRRPRSQPDLITSRQNERLKHARRLQAKRHRRELGLFLAEGEDIVGEALAEGILPAETFVAAGRPPEEGLVARLARGGPVHEVDDRLLADIGTLGHPARVVCIFRSTDLPVRETLEPGPGVSLGVHLHRVIDPGNVGTVVRACGALGPAWLSLSPGCSDPLSGKGVRASVGAVFRVPIAAGEGVPAAGLRVALVAGAGTPVWDVDLTGPSVLVVGAERYGLPDDVVDACDAVCAVPQVRGAESLNAAQAATAALYEAARQRAIHTESVAPGASGRRSNQP